jgi:hypothetical protein
MELTDETAHRALLYVKSVQRQGHAMTVAEFEAFMQRPGRSGGRPAVRRRRSSQSPLQPLLDMFARQSSGRSSVLDALLGPEEDEIVDPGSPAETVMDWLVRLGWLAAAGERVRITSLGEAVLGTLEQAQASVDTPTMIKLDQGDDLALAKVIGQIAAVGECALVDPYFSLEGFVPIVQSTRVTRVLTGSRDEQKLAMLNVALATVPDDRQFEIRKSDLFHDRFVMPAAGSVWLLGTSLNGVGNRLSMMVEVTDEAITRALSTQFEEAWDAAEPILAATPENLNAVANAAESPIAEAEADDAGLDDDAQDPERSES